MSDAHARCGDGCRWLYQQTVQMPDGSVERSLWLEPDAAWAFLASKTGRPLELRRIHSYAPAGRVQTLYPPIGIDGGTA